MKLAKVRAIILKGESIFQFDEAEAVMRILWFCCLENYLWYLTEFTLGKAFSRKLE